MPLARSVFLGRGTGSLAPVLALLLFLSSPVLAAAPAAKAGFGFESVADLARELAARPFEEPRKIPEFLLRISYDAWRDIRFKPDRSLWRGTKSPFIVQFFHPGLFYDRAVPINVVEGGKARPVSFSRDLFDYGRNEFAAKVPDDLGFAGFRIHYPINTKTYMDEVAVFLGASYFRAVARNQGYGLSARALAIDTAEPAGEEFPFFREFWLARPEPGARTITVWALLDSPSLAGAWEFVISPGPQTVFDVRLAVFRRKPVAKLGLAPLTSMFFYGENTAQRPVDDFRPEVHDSDGLLISMSGGEWLWRPLRNSRSLLVAGFGADNPRGFGLFQRDREFDSYQDLEARYERRPSAWVEPEGKWGEGRVELVQIPTQSEFNDNIIAYWVPAALPEPKERLDFDYTLTWLGEAPKLPPGGRVEASRVARGRDDRTRLFVLDFGGGRLESIPADRKVEGVVSAGQGGRIVEQQLVKNQVTKGWRLVFQVALEQAGPLDKVLPERGQPVELRAFLRLGDEALTETWSYAVVP